MYNIYNELNKITEYIENHILEEIDISFLAHSIGLNENTFKSVFNCLTGISINKYIRLRRLSLSVTDILNGESITNISYKYLYNSPSSYNRAFKSFEGITPKDLKNYHKELKLYNRIVFKENIKDYNIDYKIYKNRKFELYYISKEINYSNKSTEISEFWKEVKSHYPEFINNKRYGFFDINETRYYCLLNNKFKNSKMINIKKCNYFSIKTTSFESRKIIENINKGINEYIKSLNYHILKLPVIEVYYDNFVELLIPIT